MDEKTRTVPAMVEVADAFNRIEFGVRPPLAPGMFVELTIYGQTLDDVFVIPRDSLRDDRVYIARKGKLRIVPVNVLALEEELAVIDEGLREEDLVVMTDLFPAADGQSIRVEQIANPVWRRPQAPDAP